MIRRASLLALVALPTRALAWEHIGSVWIQEDMPIPYEVADDPSLPNSIEGCADGTGSCCEETVPQGYCTSVAVEAFEAWHAADCAEFEVFYDGICPNVETTLDYHNRFTYNDPGNFVAETGTLAVTIPRSVGGGPNILGRQYSRINDADIVFNEDVVFATHEDIAAGNCAAGGFGNGFNMRTVLTHEVGHWFGMDHSCEDPNKGGGPCTDQRLLEATMYWNEGPCETEAADISPDDIEGFNALYGPVATFECSHQFDEDGTLAVGIVPFDMHCVIVSDYLDEVTAVSWNFGDGGTGEGATATHTYEAAGNYTVQVTVDGDREACGPDGWSNTYQKVGFVRACDVPSAAFEIAHVDGLQYQMLNDSDVSVYGCIADIEWQVYEGEGVGGKQVVEPIKAWEPIIEFPDEGTYTVIMNLGGIAGTGAASVTFDVKNRRGEGQGCDTTGGIGGIGLFLAAATAFRRRR